MDIPELVVSLISQLEPCEVQDQTNLFLKFEGFTLQDDNNKIYLVKSARKVTNSHDNDLSIYEERNNENLVKSYYLWEIGSKFPPFSTSVGYCEI